MTAFIYLQVLDFMTTWVGLRLGLSEASPFIGWMMGLSPVLGLAASKVLAVLLALLCLKLHRRGLVHKITYWYAGLVVWNLSLIIWRIA